MVKLQILSPSETDCSLVLLIFFIFMQNNEFFKKKRAFEDFIKFKVAIKYPKMPGGVYRATAQPDVQWKLQQLQDANNYWAQALNTVIRITNLIGEARTTLCVPRKRTLLELCSLPITNLIGEARTTLCVPRKRTLLELCNLPVTRCFSPSLPPDLVFSYYISTNRLVCAAYQVTPKPNGWFFFLHFLKMFFSGIVISQKS
ncbi:unnamed protein product [Gongylonema pulchrum]|uniref:Uncharacterized protein n=1 Tax=Gongylonema pulchrum TaxID=637853 RepID=A0A3P7PP32_9BILA|nr:unnamed protein product [Gongylonema pulchrum]